MRRRRRLDVQTELVFKRTKNGKPMPCGKKGRSGRPRKKGRRPVPHTKRPAIRPYEPIHIVLRPIEVIGSLRKRLMYCALRDATIAVALRELDEAKDGAFRIVHISIQRTHIHLLVEADNRKPLSRGMASFQISAAKHLNRAASHGRATRRRGTVFPERYFEEVITTPKQARHALSYVLNNWRKHREDVGRLSNISVDPFSSGSLFLGWKELGDQFLLSSLEFLPPVVYLPKTWLLRVGWTRHGPISQYDVPSKPIAALARA